MLEVLQDRIGYQFRQVRLLETAMIHSSWINEHDISREHNERLEFLGDAVLELCVSAELFSRFPHEREGELTRLRSRLVSKPALVERARELAIDSCLCLGRGEENQGGRERGSLLSDAFEAMLGAVFMDGGYEAACGVVGRVFAGHWPDAPKMPQQKDYKSRLQELTQKRFGVRPVYSLLDSSGPEHEKIFTVRLTIPGDSAGDAGFVASGPSVKRAEQDAALRALAALGESAPGTDFSAG